MLYHILSLSLYEPPRDKTNKVACAFSEDSDQPGHPPSLIRVFAGAHWVAKDPGFLHVDSEDPYQTGRTPRLIWVFAGRTTTLLVLSWGGSYSFQCFRVFLVTTGDSCQVLPLAFSCHINPANGLYVNCQSDIWSPFTSLDRNNAIYEHRTWKIFTWYALEAINL